MRHNVPHMQLSHGSATCCVHCDPTNERHVNCNFLFLRVGGGGAEREGGGRREWSTTITYVWNILSCPCVWFRWDQRAGDCPHYLQKRVVCPSVKFLSQTFSGEKKVILFIIKWKRSKMCLLFLLTTHSFCKVVWNFGDFRNGQLLNQVHLKYRQLHP